MSKPTRYKEYLEPGSDEPIPSSSRYRYKKARKEEKETDSLVMMEDLEMLQNFEEDETFQSPVCAEETLIESSDISEREKRTADVSDAVFNVVQSLAHDLDLIENETKHYAEGASEVADDYFTDAIDYEVDICMDTIDDNTEPENEEDEVQNLQKKGFTSLEDATNNEVFRKPTNVPVNKTVGEVVIMILKFVLVHALSLTEATDLFFMINCIFAESFLPNTRYLRNKLFYQKSCMQLHGICSKCGAFIGKLNRKDRLVKCKICMTTVNVKDKAYTDIFVMMDAASPISKLIESNSAYYN
ncbi:uncharacterized protein LOC117181857 [Belonocnema kinseyi]|uniref:uncharacterized protein LOC117181857 n=1 Tax=Belonocnema kinseyi TaxID=2817044 RepID=UPI00143DEFD4|nr:uncharacterized protein LOC117181857 [Belonocnema kinseyi]